jgi:hypothetical protein
MSLLGVLNNYNKGNYKLSPVIVQEQDYNVYYGGISNGELVFGCFGVNNGKFLGWILGNCKLLIMILIELDLFPDFI